MKIISLVCQSRINRKYDIHDIDTNRIYVQNYIFRFIRDEVNIHYLLVFPKGLNNGVIPGFLEQIFLTKGKPQNFKRHIQNLLTEQSNYQARVIYLPENFN